MFDNLHDDTGIDLTPLIDVVFMLLVFFIMTTTFSRPVLDIVLPKAETAQNAATRARELVVGIRADGSIVHDGKELAREDLPALMEGMPEAMLNVHVDEKAPFDAFVQVVDVAREKRGGRFVISTQTASGKQVE